MSEKAQKNAIIRENRLDFLEELYKKDVELPLEQIKLLLDAGRIKLSKEGKDNLNKIPLDKVIEEEKQHLEDLEEKKLDESFDSFSLTDKFNHGTEKEIHKHQWMPKDLIEHDEKFILFIDSINRGFQKMVKYEPFRLYCEQAKRWLNDGVKMSELKYDQKRAYAINELDRCKENTLYFMDKYLKLKEGDLSSGSQQYVSKPVHKVICFLFDCGYSFMLGKPRQIAATSTLGGCALKKIILHRNFFLKFITMDKDSGIEIFEDKIKYPFGELPEWMKPEVSNDRDNLFRLSKKSGKKGTKKGVNSKLQIVAPSVSAINGGSPQLVMIDEAGYIGILGKMMKEARPTMFWQNPETRKLEMKRQIVIWGTGGEMDRGGKAYEEEFQNAIKSWGERNFEYGIIPIFCDWTTRPGITRKHYNNEKRAYSVEGPEKEARMVQFRQHYPSIVEDMFLTSNKLLVGIDWINKNLERIRDLQHKVKPIYGYFVPIFDEKKPTNENDDVPFEIIGADFVALDDTKDDLGQASAIMFLPPDREWRNRYYQGTDPIMSDNGYSNMASAIFDDHFKTISCVLNYRDANHKYTFLQTMLMGIYYNTSKKMKAVPELVESNIGTGYADYKELKGYGNSLVHRLELPGPLQGGSNMIGIDNRGNRSRFIINKMGEVIRTYGENFYIDTIFNQLRTFTCTFTEKGNETWGTADARKYHDDVLFGVTFSYICTLCYEHKDPIHVSSESDKFKMKRVLDRDKSGNLSYKTVRVKINE